MTDGVCIHSRYDVRLFNKYNILKVKIKTWKVAISDMPFTDDATIASHSQVSLERGSTVVECRTRNRESQGSNPLCYQFEVSKFGHFRSTHDASVDSAV